MSIVDRGARGERHPRSRWPEKKEWRSRSGPPQPAPPPRLRPAIATYILAAVCIAVFLHGYYGGPTVQAELIEKYALKPSDLRTGANDAYLRLVTHMFLHGGWLHLVVNMIVLLSFGRGLEPTLGTVRFTILFFVTGAAAAIGHAVFTGFSETPMIGASGADAGIVGAAVLAAPRLPVIFFIFPMRLYVAVAILVLVHVFALVTLYYPSVGAWLSTQVYNLTGSDVDLTAEADIAWWAHLAGIAAGMIVYPILRRRRAI